MAASSPEIRAEELPFATLCALFESLEKTKGCKGWKDSCQDQIKKFFNPITRGEIFQVFRLLIPEVRNKRLAMGSRPSRLICPENLWPLLVVSPEITPPYS